MSGTKYTGYFLYSEELEKHWPEKQRLKRDFNRPITKEGLDAILKRAKEHAKPGTAGKRELEEVAFRPTETKEPTSTK